MWDRDKIVSWMTWIIIGIALVGVGYKAAGTNDPPSIIENEEIQALRVELETCLGYSDGYQAGYGTFCKQVGCALGPEPVKEGK